MAPNSNIRSSQDQVPLQSFVDHYVKPFHFLGNTNFLSEGKSKSNEGTLLVSKVFFDIHIRHQQWSWSLLHIIFICLHSRIIPNQMEDYIFRQLMSYLLITSHLDVCVFFNCSLKTLEWNCRCIWDFEGDRLGKQACFVCFVCPVFWYSSIRALITYHWNISAQYCCRIWLHSLSSFFLWALHSIIRFLRAALI